MSWIARAAFLQVRPHAESQQVHRLFQAAHMARIVSELTVLMSLEWSRRIQCNRQGRRLAILIDGTRLDQDPTTDNDGTPAKLKVMARTGHVPAAPRRHTSASRYLLSALQTFFVV